MGWRQLEILFLIAYSLLSLLLFPIAYSRMIKFLFPIALRIPYFHAIFLIPYFICSLFHELPDEIKCQTHSK